MLKHSTTSGTLWPHYRDKTSTYNDSVIISLVILMFHLKSKKKQQAKQVLKAWLLAPLKYESNFSRILEMPLINCEINLIQTWSANCLISSNATANQATIFAIADTKRYVSVVTL